MKYEVSERIRTESPLREIMPVLKAQFKKVSKKVEFVGQTLVVESVEASFGSINRTDTTTIRLTKKEDGYLLVADVDYQPSLAFWIFLLIGIPTWVGWLLPIAFYLTQQRSVRAAIELCMKRVKDEFSQQAPKPARAASLSSIGDLEKLAELKDKGVITPEEFEVKKKQILGL